MISINNLKALFKNKKGQAITVGQQYVSRFVIQIFSYSLISFGAIQAFSFMYKPFNGLVDNLVTSYFGGYTLVFLFFAAGFIGLALNEIFGRLLNPITGLPVIEKRTWLFILIGLLCVIIGVTITALGNAMIL